MLGKRNNIAFYIYGVEVEQKLIDGTRTLYIAEWHTFLINVLRPLCIFLRKI